jgi:uroporphyrinogen-III synthase
MPQNKISILCTMAIDQAVVRDAESLNVFVDVLPFIKTEQLSSIEIQQEIEQASTLEATVIFTSVAAVEAVAAELNEYRPPWVIFCIGYATRLAVEKFFGADVIVATADNAKNLADIVIKEGHVDTVIFFCGDQRRDELPELLRQNNIDINEIVVYHTVAVPRKVEKKYDGILFFSPSAVRSFFQNNQLDHQTTLFAIGNTTAAEIKKHSTNKVVVGREPKKELLLANAINYFQANSIRH